MANMAKSLRCPSMCSFALLNNRVTELQATLAGIGSSDL